MVTMRLTYTLLFSLLIAAPLSAAAKDYNDALLTQRPVNTAKDAPLASLDSVTGKLSYGPYANHKRKDKINIIPDFSYAGYMGGGIALPSYTSIPLRVSLSPQDEGDDYVRIKDAIDQIAALPPDARGIRGAVHLAARGYRISQPLLIQHSGIILRGDGQGKDGTIIESTSREHKSVVIRAAGSGSGRKTRPAQQDYRTAITQPLIPVGSTSIEVASSDGYKVGDKIAIFKTPNEYWLGRKGINTARFG